MLYQRLRNGVRQSHPFQLYRRRHVTVVNTRTPRRTSPTPHRRARPRCDPDRPCPLASSP